LLFLLDHPDKPGDDSLRRVMTLPISPHIPKNRSDDHPHKSVTYVSVHLLPMSPVHTPLKGEGESLVAASPHLCSLPDGPGQTVNEYQRDESRQYSRCNCQQAERWAKGESSGTSNQNDGSHQELGTLMSYGPTD
jgi:hypothetical protein